MSNAYKRRLAPNPLHIRRLHPLLVETIRQQNSILDALSAHRGEHADDMRRTATARRNSAQDTLNINLGQPITQENQT